MIIYLLIGIIISGIALVVWATAGLFPNNNERYMEQFCLIACAIGCGLIWPITIVVLIRYTRQDL